MTTEQMPAELRVEEFFSHIDMGFLNRRLAISALGPARGEFIAQQKPGTDHMTVLNNDHRLVTMLIDVCSAMKAPTLAEALTLGRPKQMFMSIERLEPCPEIYSSARVFQGVHLEFDYGKPVVVAYHTSHVCSDTGRMTLSDGYPQGYREAMIGLLHDKGDRFEIEPIVIGAPYLDHPRNTTKGGSEAVWGGYDYGEILPEDIAEFAKISEVRADQAAEWMSVMRQLPETSVKEAIARLLAEPAKKDWGGEENDHFSANVTVAGRRRTAAFLLKGPAVFKEMTPAMCGKNGDQIYRLTRAGADISIVQHAHLISPAVRETLRAFVVTPGHARMFCVMDGQVTYRLLKAYGLLPSPLTVTSARVIKAQARDIRCSPKAEVGCSNHLGCANIFKGLHEPHSLRLKASKHLVSATACCFDQLSSRDSPYRAGSLRSCGSSSRRHFQHQPTEARPGYRLRIFSAWRDQPKFEKGEHSRRITWCWQRVCVGEMPRRVSGNPSAPSLPNSPSSGI